MLDKRLKEDWIIALRSGEYRQARKAWTCRDTNMQPVEYCCLSVLAHRIGYRGACGIHYPEPGYISPEYLGLSGKEQVAFVRANDDLGLTFEEIADRIEDGRLKC